MFQTDICLACGLVKINETQKMDCVILSCSLCNRTIDIIYKEDENETSHDL